MDVSHLLDGLNDDQRQAVASPLGAALVLAGAGSGKTRVLVHRVAWLIQVEGASPNSILAVTFTNKAAAEMRSRIETLLGLPSGAMWLGTFHGLAHRLLRIHWREAGLPQSFQILDSEDQARVLRKVLKSLDLDETRWIPREILWFINAQKDEGHRAKHIKDDGDPTRRQLIKIYQAYEEACQRAGVVDFAQQQLREVHDARALTSFFVRLVDLDQLAPGWITIVLDVFGAVTLVLLRVDEPENLARNPARLVQIERLQYLAQDARLILGIQDLKALRQTCFAPMDAQQPVRQAMKSPQPHGAARQPQQGFDAAAHFRRRFVGEGHSEDAVRRSALYLDQPCDPMHQYPGFAAAGAGQYQRGSQRRGNRLPLSVIQPVEKMRYVHQGADCTA